MPSMTDSSKRASREPHFFKVLLPNFSIQLQLPRAFVKKHIIKEDAKAGSATLLSPDWKTWNVALHKNQQDTYLSGDEWRACTQALNLKVGYFLLFSYKGNMLFSFKVFDLSTCDKPYPVPHLYPQPQCELAPVSAQTVSAAAAQRIRTKTVANAVAARRKKRCKSAHVFDIAAQHGNSGSITSICKVCKCTSFEAHVTSTNLSQHRYMRIPVPFLDISGLSKEHERLTLVDPKGGSWLVDLLHARDKKAKSGYYTRMGGGWKQFSLANQLEVGDRCVFELEAGEKDMMHVQVLKT